MRAQSKRGALLVAAVGLLAGCGEGSPAKVRLVDHHCVHGSDGVVVSAQLANDAKTGPVQASGYVLLYTGQIIDANGWQYEKPITGGQSDFFTGTVPVSNSSPVLGCGVLLGDGAPQGVQREGDGGDH